MQRRLEALASFADVTVVSPVAYFQYGNPSGERVKLGRTGIPSGRLLGPLTVLHPRWFYSPFTPDATPFWMFARLAPFLRRIRRDFAFDIIDTHFGYPEGITGALLASALSVPFTMTFRGNEPKHSQSATGRRAMSWAIRRASGIFAVSERLRQFAMQLGSPADRVRTIPNGVDSSLFFPRDRDSCRVKHGLALHRPVIVSAGALVERKGHHRVIEALKFLAARGTRAQLVIVGGPGPEGAYEHALRELVDTLNVHDSVLFAGGVAPAALAELMSAADLVCLASTNEGWPNVIHEALACGTPVVATDVGAIPEMLDGGRNGLLAPTADQETLGAAIAKALAQPWDREAISGWAHARSWQQVASEVFQEMQIILAGTGPQAHE